MKVKGKVALITGAARAIGRAHALSCEGKGKRIEVKGVNAFVLVLLPSTG
jgi:NAD(P)-dependent dehydrogenase (short-subunit alcohol dehydrogenase family)